MNTQRITRQSISTHHGVLDEYVQEKSLLIPEPPHNKTSKNKISTYNVRQDIVKIIVEGTDNIEQEKLVSPIALKSKLVKTVDAFTALKDEWNELYALSEGSAVFSSWEWMYTWWEVYKDQCKRQLYIICFYQYDQLIGIAPFQIDKSYPQVFVQGKTLRFIGLGDRVDDRILSQYLDFIVMPGFETEMIKSVSNYLVKHKKEWDFADLEYLLEDALVLQCFKSGNAKIARNKVEYGVRYFIPKMQNFDSYKDKLGSRWRKMFVKKDRLLNRDGDVKINTIDTIEGIHSAFEQLSDMHCSRWKGKVDHCVFESSRFMRFHKKVLDRLLPEKKAFIKTLSLNGEALAAYYVFTDKGQVHYYQSGFYSQYANKYSPLFILVCKEIGVAIEENHTFDFMYTDSTNSYKQSQYSAESEKMYRLRWASNPARMFVFKCSKAIYVRVVNLYVCTIKHLIKYFKKRN